jgi:hypothetical protein
MTAIVAMDAAARAEFSCPSAPAYSAQGLYLAFEQGFMLRLDESPLIYVYYQATGEWEQVVSAGAGEAPSPGGSPADVPPAPFGPVWAENQRALALGPVQGQPAVIDALVQVFGGGVLVGNRGEGSVLVFPRSRLRL